MPTDKEIEALIQRCKYTNRHHKKYMSIGTNIHHYRTLKCLTLAELAIKANISELKLICIEDKLTVPPISVYFDIADALEISPNLLFELEKE